MAMYLGTLKITPVIVEIKAPSSDKEIRLRNIIERKATEITAEDLEGMSTIPEYFYYLNYMLESITFPNSITSIGLYAFYNNSLSAIAIPDSVTSIDTKAFFGNVTLKSITLSNNLTSISDGMLQNCRALTNITIPDSVTSIGSSAFYGISLTSITIPDSVTSIGSSAFQSCSDLTDITIGKSVTKISDNAFNSINVRNIYIKDFTAFCNITFTGVTAVPFYNTHVSTSDKKLYLNGILTKDLIIPSGFASINENAFYGFPVDTITLPDSVTSIGPYAFAFSSITGITLGTGILTLGERAFLGCTKLSNITLPNSITNIGSYLFVNCSKLSNIIYSGTIEQWNAITKGRSWNYNILAKYVQCSDGQVQL